MTVTVGEFAVNAVVGGALTGAAEKAGEALGSKSLGPATGAVSQGSANVLINGLPAGRVGDAESCHAGLVAQGSSGVFINGRAAARAGDKTTCGAVIVGGSANVFIGGGVTTRLPIQSEVPQWARWAAVVIGLLPALGGAARALASGIAEVAETGLTRAAQTGVKALGRAMEERAGAASSSAGRAVEAARSVPDEATIAARRATAQNFYARQGWPQAKIDSHMRGIDFNQPVEVVPLDSGTTVGQWQTPGGAKGNYFSSSDETPSRLGISTVGHDPNIGAISKVQTMYVSDAQTQALKTTAAPMRDDWSNPYSVAQTSGGGTQFFVPDNSVFKSGAN